MSEWQIKRIKDIGKLRLGKMLTDKPKEGYHLRPYLKSKNVGWNELKLESVEEMYFSDTELKDLRLHKNDLVISEGGEVGKTSIWHEELQECYIQNSVHKLTFNRDINPKYYLYLFYDLGHKGYFKSIVNLVSIMHLTYEKLRRLNVPVPSIDVQNNIVDYLDEKTKAIDVRISVLEKKSDAYTRLKASVINRAITRGLNPNVTLKDSGIEWIGMIPEHWEVKRVKDNFCIKRGRVIPATELVDDGLYPVYSSQTENDGCMGFINTYDFDQKCLTWTTDGVNAGTVFLRKGKFNCTNICGILVPILRNIYLPFHYYSLYQTCKHNKRIDTNGAKIMSNEMAVIKYPIPPLYEQQSIATYLDTKCSEIDKAIDNIGKQIEALKRLKRSLINEVVTGKRKV